MNGFPYILFAIGIALVLLLVLLVVLKVRGFPVAQRRANPRTQLIIAISATVFLTLLWWFYDFPVAILPALILPQWIALYAQRGEPSARKKWIMAALVGLTVLAVLATVVFWVRNS